MQANYKHPFQQYVKKAHKPLQLGILDVVEAICEDFTIGEVKAGDLAGLRVYKFKLNRQECLVAYRPPILAQFNLSDKIEFLAIDFYQVGTHENFYDILKRYLQEE